MTTGPGLTRRASLPRRRARAAARGFIFAGERGATLRPNTFRKRAWAKAVAASVGLPCTPNDLRHTHETWMAKAGIHPKVMQGRSGQKDSCTTLDVYTRYQPGLDAVAADAMERIYRESRTNGDQTGTGGRDSTPLKRFSTVQVPYQ
jgi:integrase